MKQGMLLAGLLLAANGAWAQGSPYIQEIEEQLQQLGFDPGPVDGRFDSRLTAAINAFKSSRNLPQDGLLDARTRDLLARAVAPQPAPLAPVTVVQPAPPPVVQAVPRPAPAPAPVVPSSGPGSQAAPVMASKTPTQKAAGGVVFGWTAGGGYESGGDEVATVFLDDNTTESIKAGEGVSVMGGLTVKPSARSRWEFRAVGGFKYRETSATNSNLHVRRFTHELSARVRLFGDVWFGAGAQAHTGIRYHGDGLTEDAKFDNAVGTVLQLGWRGLWLTATQIDYRAENGVELDAGSVGVIAAYPF